MRTVADLPRVHFHEMKSDFNTWRALYAEEAVMEYRYRAYAVVLAAFSRGRSL